MANRRRPVGVRATPKVFHTNYQPPQKFDWSVYRKLGPLLLVLSLVALIYFIAQLPALRVQTVTTSGEADATIIKQLTALRGDSLLTQTLQNNINTIKNNNLIIKSLDCRRGIPGTLECTVSLRQSVVTWQTNGHDYLIDSQGLAYATTNKPAGLLVVDQGNVAVKVGQQVLAPALINDYLQLNQLLGANHLVASQFYINDTFYQVGVVLTGSNDSSVPFPKNSPIDLLMTFDQPLSGQIATTVEILKEKSGQITNHIDVRVPGYAYIQ